MKFPDEVFRWTSWDAILMILVRHCLIASYFIIMYHDIVSYLETIFQIVRIPWTNLSKMVYELFVLSLATDQLFQMFQQTFAWILSMSNPVCLLVLPRRIISYNMIQSTLEKFWRECFWYTLVEYHWISHVSTHFSHLGTHQNKELGMLVTQADGFKKMFRPCLRYWKCSLPTCGGY